MYTYIHLQARPVLMFVFSLLRSTSKQATLRLGVATGRNLGFADSCAVSLHQPQEHVCHFIFAHGNPLDSGLRPIFLTAVLGVSLFRVGQVVAVQTALQRELMDNEIRLLKLLGNGKALADVRLNL